MASRKKKLRVITPAFTVAPPTKLSTRTRLRVTPEEEEVLNAVGVELSRLEGWALARRCQLGSKFTKVERATLKRDLTAKGLTSRQAGSLVNHVMGVWRSRRKAQKRELTSLTKRIKTIESKLRKPAGKRGAYRSSFVCFQKTRRLVLLKERRQALRITTRAAKVSVARGGRGLLKTRHNLGDAELTVKEWSARWNAKRNAFAFAGESGKVGGNETLHVDGAGRVELRLPNSLAGLANASHGRYVFAVPVAFAVHKAQLMQAITARAAIQYRIHHDPVKARWYLDATFSITPTTPQADAGGRVVGVDVNADHLAVWARDKFGNPLGRPLSVPLVLTGLPASARDSRLRHALSTVVAYALRMDAKRVAIEDLGFADDLLDSKENKTKRFRHTVHDMPVAQLRARAAAMFSRAGLELVAVDSAYTSKWAWPYVDALNVTGHEAAALMISLRADALRGRRRGKPGAKQSISVGHLPVQTSRKDGCEDAVLRVKEARQPTLGVRPRTPTRKEQGTVSTREQDRSVSGAATPVTTSNRSMEQKYTV